MPDEHPLTLRQADQALRLCLIEEQLVFLAGQIARVPKHRDLALTALGIIFCTAVVTTLFVWMAWH